MIYILDTNVISAVRRAGRAPQVAAWLGGQADSELYLSVLTIGEVERGIGLQQSRDPQFAADLTLWLDRTVTLFADRILPFTADDARIWGALSAALGHPGVDLAGVDLTGVDLMIAAQALARDGTVVTGNTSDFAATGAKVIDPF